MTTAGIDPSTGLTVEQRMLMAKRWELIDIGRTVEVEMPNGTWVPGEFLGYVGSLNPDEDFLRCNVQVQIVPFMPTTLYSCHPDCVRIPPPESCA